MSSLAYLRARRWQITLDRRSQGRPIVGRKALNQHWLDALEEIGRDLVDPVKDIAQLLQRVDAQNLWRVISVSATLANDAHDAAYEISIVARGRGHGAKIQRSFRFPNPLAREYLNERKR